MLASEAMRFRIELNSPVKTANNHCSRTVYTVFLVNFLLTSDLIRIFNFSNYFLVSKPRTEALKAANVSCEALCFSRVFSLFNVSEIAWT